MQNFQSLEELESGIKAGDVRIPQPIKVDGIEYFYRDSTHYSLEEMLSDPDHHRGIVVYAATPKEDNLRKLKDQGALKDRLLITWRAKDGMAIVPEAVRTVSRHRLVLPSEGYLIEELTKVEKEVRDKVAKSKLAAAEDDLDTKREINKLKRKEAYIKARVAKAKARAEEEELTKIEESKIEALVKDKIAASKLASAQERLRLEKEISELKKKTAYLQAGVKAKKAAVEDEELKRKMDSIMNPAEQDDGIIGLKLQIVLTGFNGNEPIEAKVDTGADVSSLHATDVRVSDGSSLYGDDKKTVSFVHGNKNYKMNIATMQSVSSSDGGVEYRPCVMFNVKVGEDTYENILFNLNDRGNMDTKILLGINAIEKMDVKIDVTKEGVEFDDENDWDYIQFVAQELI